MDSSLAHQPSSTMYSFFLFVVLLATARALPIETEGGSDLPMTNAGFFGGDMAGFDPEDRNAITNANLRWPNGVIPYVIDSSLNQYSNMIQQAMQHYHQYTCLRFVQRTNQRDYIFIYAQNGCWSYVGRQGGQQQVSLGRGCEYRGTIIHELLHAAGFWHEQNRPDRDNHITIYYNNIMSGQEHNFRKMGYNEVTLLQENYDLGSIMQYGETAFSKDGRTKTIVAKNGQHIYDAYEKSGLSQSDIRRIQRLYQC